ncbi:hypothetical protein BDA99DRAFT_542766 [Phascolomyces articulosus]|uniref:Uncharacterized protein n=1 Tax=Phascolomyces articulosus TaxID=60185 RepID=A0AAD5JPQ6_9FUNG|nr:hypothetical protein BDA99DRAFT_542766 [Phascolomyces articulosus]
MNKTAIFKKHIIGSPPIVPTGFRTMNNVQLASVGLHGTIQAGIDGLVEKGLVNDQTIEERNLLLAKCCAAPFVDIIHGADVGDNWRQGVPIRVIRGYRQKDKLLSLQKDSVTM